MYQPTLPERNLHPVPLSSEQRRRLQDKFLKDYGNKITNLVQEWRRESASLGDAPTEAEVKRILEDTASTCEYWLIDGLCRLLLNRPYRDYSHQNVPRELKQEIAQKLAQFKQGRGIAWGKFNKVWVEKLNDLFPPSSETIRKFLNLDYETCEHWVVNGLSQIFLDCLYEEWMQQFFYQTDINPPGLEKDPEQKMPPLGDWKLPVEFPLRTWEDEAPELSNFYGRQEELGNLAQWIVSDRARLVVLLGLGGMGKTYLSIRCAQMIQHDFDRIKWISLRHAPPLLELLGNVIQCLSPQFAVNLPETSLEAINRLMEGLRSHRCLLILDEWETLLASGELAGQYRNGYKDYGELIRQISREPHQSCLLLTSREPSQSMPYLEQENLTTHLFTVQGLEPAAARQILQDNQLKNPEDWHKLIELYRANPLALMTIGPLIKYYFNGKVSTFIQKNTVVVDDALQEVLKQQWETVSEGEQQIMYGLAIARKPISVAALKPQILSTFSESEWLQIITSLSRRSLLEISTMEDEAHFSLQPAVMKYITKDLIDRVCQEISTVIHTQNLEIFDRLRTHQIAINYALSSEIHSLQTRVILTPIKEKLVMKWRSDRRLGVYLTQMLVMLAGKSALEVGYVAENLQNLLKLLPKSEG
ncbi:NB-ARC domain-containing protein [Laspinema olomoucense]|uniref:NB-ARC domain-containing protein n=1 Tax=Laspinema olomoucense D3b TaxID=2953688 RepID=A0ABT2NAF1_9CYAN|nr:MULTISPECIES: NB-ARC domain-containing protein [unclassified Laspinema]MCT7979674.1 NB-ARC domain-containing protein [Laspinema sp. D3b]MCT7996088.1 NB-ARC domain-containing protein [Laspinema sp. D3c]